MPGLTGDHSLWTSSCFFNATATTEIYTLSLHDALPIYRRYRSKDELVTGAVASLVSEITIPDTGSTRADLLELMSQAVELYSGSLAAGVIPTLVDEARRNPVLAPAIRDGFLRGRRAALSAVLER